MIDRLLAEGGGDWIEDVADALPMTVIGDIIGIPEMIGREIFDSLDRILKATSPEARPSRARRSRTLRHDLRLRDGTHRRKAAQPHRRHLEHAGVRGDHRRRR